VNDAFDLLKSTVAQVEGAVGLAVPPDRG
jgi:hypothetical protein